MNRKHLQPFPGRPATKRNIWPTAVACTIALLILFGNGSLYSQDVALGISSREAWIGSPIVFQIQVSNASKYTLPELFEIDGCDVQAAGTPSRSSQITIINGRRSESQSVTMQYLITPKREGNFEIPELEIIVDGKVETTQPIKFVASKSETGDLLFVEIEGNKNKVYVGEPLELNLKLWIKPFSDREKRIKLNEGHMWQRITEQTSWGSFTDRLQELAENRRRPRGESVLRKDDDGREGEYFLYEIEATVYPNKAGKIDASDLLIVVDYPEALGRRRDPFDSLFDDSMFSSPFGRRLTVSKSRPVTAEVSVDSTEVLAVPVANRPADYRGAVGKYQIIAAAEPTTVSAGDPITLRIGIGGDGPMELVQAPPLHEIESLTRDFQITDQSLAGFVQGRTKGFVTSIRPRNENVIQIPPIPFSFFDPDKESYETVYTQPISIEVEKAESLDMNSIVSGVAGGGTPDAATSLADTTEDFNSAQGLDLQNSFSMSVVQSNTPDSSHWWWYFAIVPPLCWGLIALGRIACALPGTLALLKSAKSQASHRINSASGPAELADALCEFIAKRTKCLCPTYQHAAGKLREHQAYEIAAQFESFCDKRVTRAPGFAQSSEQHGSGYRNSNRNEPAASASPLTESGRSESGARDVDLSLAEAFEETRHESLELLESIEAAFDAARQKPVSRANRNKRGLLRKSIVPSLIGLAFLGAGSSSFASSELSTDKLQTIFEEANSTYQAAEQLLESDPAKARELFSRSANRYQLLVEEGIRNEGLFLNLGNAWHQSGESANAILNYHRALWMNPGNLTAQRNLHAIQQTGPVDGEPNSTSVSQWLAGFVSVVGQKPIRIAFAISSVLFWLLLSIKTLRRRSKLLRWSVIPLVLAMASGLICYQAEQSEMDLAIVVANTIELKSGDGSEFNTELKLDAAAGKTVTIIGQRADWQKVRLPDGKTGWLPKTAVEKVAL